MKVEITVTTGPAEGRHFVFDQPDCFLFGRAADARICLPDDPYVSRHHFLLEVCPPKVKVTDLDSKNGLFVNQVRYGGRKAPGPGVVQAPNGKMETTLEHGDEIVVGDTCMAISIEKAAVCLECGRAISVEEGGTSGLIENRAVCGECRRKEKRALRRIICIRCDRDVTDEAGLRWQEAESGYVCRDCREREADHPMALLEALLKAAVPPEGEPRAPAFRGYRVEGELGRGGMGMVYKAVEKKTGRPVAIKTMLPQVAENESNARVFLREVEVTRQLRHKNIVELFHHDKTDGLFYFVLEFVDGVDLEHLIQNKGGRLELEDAVPIFLGTLEGLGYAHRAKLKMEIAGGKKKRFAGVVHRDLKPQNILLGKEGGTWVPKVADFGLSKSFESAGLTDMTVMGQVAGTPVYWPREQITHYKYLNPATDVFSIAAVFYEALTGARVREGFDEMFSQCRLRRRTPGLSDYMRVIAKNPPVPVRDRSSRIPAAVAEVLDRALREAEVPHEEDRMRDALSDMRYPDAWAFRNAWIEACRKEGIKV